MKANLQRRSPENGKYPGHETNSGNNNHNTSAQLNEAVKTMLSGMLNDKDKLQQVLNTGIIGTSFPDKKDVALLEYLKKHQDFKITSLIGKMEKDYDRYSTSKELEAFGGIPHLEHVRLDYSTQAEFLFDSAIERVIKAENTRQIADLAAGILDASNAGDFDKVRELQYKLMEFDIKAQDKLGELQLIDLSSITEPPAQKWIMKHLIPDKYPTILYADGGIGKSYLSLHLAILAAIGCQNFLNYEFPDESLNVLILDWELEVNEFARRAIKVSKGMGLNAIPEGLYYAQPAKTLKKLIKQIKRIVKEKNIHLVVIDSLGAACVDPEMIDIVELFAALKTLDVAILVIDHQSKLQDGQEYQNKKPYGSAYKFNLSRSALQLSPMERDGNRVTLRLRHKKSNFGKLVDDMVFDMTFEADAVRFYRSNAKTPEQSEIELVRDTIQALEKITDKVNKKAIAEELKDEIGRNKLLKLLDKHSGEYWDVVPGERTEKLYKTRSLESHPHIDRNSKLLKSGNGNSESETKEDEPSEKKAPIMPDYLK